MAPTTDKPILAIDCDEVLLPTGTHWLQYLNDRAGTDLIPSDIGFDYNIGRHFPQIKDPKEFFAGNVYDSLAPYSRAVEVVRKLSELYTIVIVSHCIRNHHESKERFIERYFDDSVSAFVATDKKWTVKADVFVDDRVHYLMDLDEQTVKILFRTIWKQSSCPVDALERMKVPNLIADDWEHLESILTKMHSYLK